jgi:hypothetical protein
MRSVPLVGLEKTVNRKKLPIAAFFRLDDSCHVPLVVFCDYPPRHHMTEMPGFNPMALEIRSHGTVKQHQLFEKTWIETSRGRSVIARHDHPRDQSGK